MYEIKWNLYIAPLCVPDTTKSARSIRESEISGLCTGIGNVKVFHNSVLKISMSSVEGLSRALRVASNCYIEGIIDASILFSSIAVERMINIDKRMQQARTQLKIDKKGHNPTGWLSLTADTLKKANKEKLPVTVLLDHSESLRNNKFIKRRNMIAHGDYSAYIIQVGINSDSGFTALRNDINIPQKEALDQFKKCSAFITAWTKQNPDIIDLQIRRKLS